MPKEALVAFEATLKRVQPGAMLGVKAAEKAGDPAQGAEYYEKVVTSRSRRRKTRADVNDARVFLAKKS